MTKSGLVAVIGRPNVGKSTLVNQMVGAKVSITAASPNTTRQAIRGVITEDGVQVIFVDTPGLHKPKTSLGGRLNEAARTATDGVDVIMALLDVTASLGPGDRAVLRTLFEQARRSREMAPIVVLNKMDRVGREAMAAKLIVVHEYLEEMARELEAHEVLARLEIFPLSAKKGTGAEELLAYLRTKMPESPYLFPEEEVSDVPEAQWIAELVREQLVRKTRQELPHSIHCRVAEMEWPHILVEILVERDSQKGMVIGKNGQLLKDVGIAARRQLPEGCFLELKVSVEPGWQQRDDALDRFGY